MKVNTLAHSAKSLVNRLFPHHCLLCGAPGEASLCDGCRETLPWNQTPCLQCGLPLTDLETASLCGRCLRESPAFDRSWSALVYTPPVTQLINQFKHRRDLVAGQCLSDQLAHYLAAHQALADADALIPTPLHWRRRLSRTFNQSAYIARHLSRRFRLPLLTPLRRVQPTPRQQQLSRRQRLRNLRGAFRLDGQSLADRHLVVVDDVMTTGATAQALAQLLKTAGAARVDVCCLARTPAAGKK